MFTRDHTSLVVLYIYILSVVLIVLTKDEYDTNRCAHLGLYSRLWYSSDIFSWCSSGVTHFHCGAQTHLNWCSKITFFALRVLRKKTLKMSQAFVGKPKINLIIYISFLSFLSSLPFMFRDYFCLCVQVLFLALHSHIILM